MRHPAGTLCSIENYFGIKIFCGSSLALKGGVWTLRITINPAISNIYVGSSEAGGQCGDYALAFVNVWNKKYLDQALLVIQQQELAGFPDGLYKVVGKDNRSLPFLKNRTISMLYVWDGIQGIGHPELGGYTIKLVKRLHIKSHFGIPNWEHNGPHVWVIVGDISVDPTYADYMPLIVMRRVHTQELACAREPWGVKGGMTPETYTLPKQQYPAVYGGLG